MKRIALFISIAGLIMTICPSFLHFFGVLSWKTHAQAMFIGMILWFVFAPVWYFKKA